MAWLDPCHLGKWALEVATENRIARKELMTHLFRMHGFNSRPGLGLTLEQLATLHTNFHLDDHCLPPHSHTAEGEIKLTLGEDYIDRSIRGILSNG